jgi:ribosomal protein S25
MAEIAEITLKDREKIKNYVKNSNFLTYTMLAKRFGISKSELSLIMNGKKNICRGKQNY